MPCNVGSNALIAAARTDNADAQRFFRAALDGLAGEQASLGMFFGNERHRDIDLSLGQAKSGGLSVRINVAI
jgi:hypothetical protein